MPATLSRRASIAHPADRPPCVVHVRQGDVVATDDPSHELRALLGSCVSVCLHDPVRGFGAMTHTVHADPSQLGEAVPFNDYERAFNALMKLGARRDTIRASVVGGAHVTASSRPVGFQLATFILQVLAREQVLVVRRDVGGDRARRIRFRACDGVLDVERVPFAQADGPDGAPRRSGTESP